MGDESLVNKAFIFSRFTKHPVLLLLVATGVILLSRFLQDVVIPSTAGTLEVGLTVTAVVVQLVAVGSFIVGAFLLAADLLAKRRK